MNLGRRGRHATSMHRARSDRDRGAPLRGLTPAATSTVRWRGSTTWEYGVAPPTGTVTFLFAEVEDPAPGREQHPAATRSALIRHDAIVRGAVERARGWVIRAAGDGFRAAFDDPGEAVSAAVAI